MTTLKERFNLQWAKDDEPRLREFALTFFRQELLALADEVEKERAKYISLETEYSKDKARGLWQAANHIRAKANELSDPNQLI